MTEREFLNNITGWQELIEFCQEWGCGICDAIYDDEARDAEIDASLSHDVREHSWQTIASLLNDIPTYKGYFLKLSTYHWEDADDELFLSYKDDVHRWAISARIFDDDETDSEPKDPASGEDVTIEEWCASLPEALEELLIHRCSGFHEE